MDHIVNIRNFNAYSGRYSRKANPKTPENGIGWYIEDNLLEKFPVLALRNRAAVGNTPFSWKQGRNLSQAIDLTLQSLKSWQAFRPSNPDSIIANLKVDIPGLVIRFQRKMHQSGVTKLSALTRLNQTRYNSVLKLVAETVGDVSSYKSDSYPMLGSKVMHFLLPEFFPVWDTAWIKQECLTYEKMCLEEWLPDVVIDQLSECNQAAVMYARYFALLLNDLDQIGVKEYTKVTNALIRHSKISQDIIYWHFYDLSPIVFEFCLLGKHLGNKAR